LPPGIAPAVAKQAAATRAGLPPGIAPAVAKPAAATRAGLPPGIAPAVTRPAATTRAGLPPGIAPAAATASVTRAGTPAPIAPAAAGPPPVEPIAAAEAELSPAPPVAPAPTEPAAAAEPARVAPAVEPARGAPAARAAEPAARPVERRAEPRIETDALAVRFSTAVKVDVDGAERATFPAFTRDVSRSGAFIKTSRRVAVDDRGYLSITMPGDDEWSTVVYEVEITVVRVEPLAGFAARFEELPDGLGEAIDALAANGAAKGSAT
jgi:hypothetical protein